MVHLAVGMVGVLEMVGMVGRRMVEKLGCLDSRGYELLTVDFD